MVMLKGIGWELLRWYAEVMGGVGRRRRLEIPPGQLSSFNLL
ncbi:hypothetical protein [Pyrobaculum aerophilum]